MSFRMGLLAQLDGRFTDRRIRFRRKSLSRPILTGSIVDFAEPLGSIRSTSPVRAPLCASSAPVGVFYLTSLGIDSMAWAPYET